MSLLYSNELQYRLQYGIIAGVDEAGRGPLAGPLVVSSCILPDHFLSEHLNDSKMISENIRDNLYHLIINNALDYVIEVIPSTEIDRLNIFQATMKGILTAVNKLKINPSYVLIDGNRKPEHFPFNGEAIIKGDSKIASIAAASILSKVTRDRIMKELHNIFPQYGFSTNKGYPTKAHLQAIKDHGICEHHRRSYKPVKMVLYNQYEDNTINYESR